MTAKSTVKLAIAIIGIMLTVALYFAGYLAFSAQGRFDDALAARDDSRETQLFVGQSDRLVSASLATAEAELAQLEAVLVEREKFGAQLARIREGAAAAVGKVDTAQWLDHAAALQDQVVTIDTDPAKVAELTAQIAAAADAIEGAVAEHDAKAQRQPADTSKDNAAGTSNPATSGDPIARGREVLASIGGSWVDLQLYDGNCSGQQALGCAYRGGVIKISAASADLGDARFNWVIVHEYAHQVQYQSWDAITGHQTYRDLFGSNIELLANCMASAWGYTAHGHSCSSQMIDEARAVWAGSFR